MGLGRDRRSRDPGRPGQLSEQRGDAGYNVAFEGSLPKMWLGLLLVGMIVGVPAYLLLGVTTGDQERDAEAVAACEGWKQLRADRLAGEVSPDEQVERAREIQALAEAADFHVSLFGVIANRLGEGMDLAVHADRADTVCEGLASSTSIS